MNFKVGDKVICISCGSLLLALTAGKVYKVVNLEYDYVRVINDKNRIGGYLKDRFILATPLTEELC